MINVAFFEHHSITFHHRGRSFVGEKNSSSNQWWRSPLIKSERITDEQHNNSSEQKMTKKKSEGGIRSILLTEETKKKETWKDLELRFAFFSPDLPSTHSEYHQPQTMPTPVWHHRPKKREVSENCYHYLVRCLGTTCSLFRPWSLDSYSLAYVVVFERSSRRFICHFDSNISPVKRFD